MATNNLYVFGIGGTGSRVLRSLTMLLAAGVKCDYNIVPVIIDPDASAGDLTRTVSLLNLYNKIYDKSSSENSSFFKTEIRQIVPNFTLPFVETTNEKFHEFMRLSSMNEITKSFMKTLFSEENLEADMGIGFKGCPSMGTIVLNQFAYNDDFRKFCTNFKQDDRIFIISSIMGGTGSSGFPLLLKLLRNASNTQENQALPNAKLISRAMIGAVTVLPYFLLDKPSNPNPKTEYIDSESFISKAKSALSYYQNGISRKSYQNLSVRQGCDALYYVGDTNTATYENIIGGTLQKNDSHFIEVASALAIMDFAKNVQEPEMQTIHKDFGLRSNTDSDIQTINLSNLSDQSMNIMGKPLTKMWMLHQFVKCRQQEDKKKNEQWIRTLGGESLFQTAQFNQALGDFLELYVEWLKELANNRVAFKPFLLETDSNKDLFESVVGITHNKRHELLPKNRSYDYFSCNLIENAPKIKKDGTEDQKYMELFSKVIDIIIDNKLPEIREN